MQPLPNAGFFYVVRSIYVLSTVSMHSLYYTPPNLCTYSFCVHHLCKHGLCTYGPSAHIISARVVSARYSLLRQSSAHNPYAIPSMARRVKVKPIKLAMTALMRAIALVGFLSKGSKGSIAL